MHTHIGLLIMNLDYLRITSVVGTLVLFKQRNNTANIQMLIVLHNHDCRKVDIIMIMKNTS